jgi:hypothetical protein
MINRSQLQQSQRLSSHMMGMPKKQTSRNQSYIYQNQVMTNWMGITQSTYKVCLIQRRI